MDRHAPPHPSVRECDPPPRRRVRSQGDRRRRRGFLHARGDLVLGLQRDRMIELLTALAPESKRGKARTTYLEIDRRLGAHTLVKFLMVGAIGLVLSAGFYAVGLHYWLLVGGFVSLVEIITVIGPLVGALLIVAVGLPQSLIDVL